MKNTYTLVVTSVDGDVEKESTEAHNRILPICSAITHLVMEFDIISKIVMYEYEEEIVRLDLTDHSMRAKDNKRHIVYNIKKVDGTIDSTSIDLMSRITAIIMLVPSLRHKTIAEIEIVEDNIRIGIMKFRTILQKE